jgi:glycosyltransferase involved in cell wall biosynthesis
MADQKMTRADSTAVPASVLVDATSLNRRVKGVGRYAWHLCEALSESLPQRVRLILVAFRVELPEFPAGFRGQWLTIPYHAEVRLGLWEFPRLIQSTGASVFIRPAEKIGRRYAVPTLTVCHDLNPMIWAAKPPRTRYRRLLDGWWELMRGQGLRHSARVICNSEFVRTAAVRHFGLAREKTSLGYCGVDRRILELAASTDATAVRDKLGTAGFLLAFATGDEREGFRILPELWAAARQAGYRGKLVVAGVKQDEAYAIDLRHAFNRSGEADSVVLLPFLGEDKLAELAGLYRAADFYLETSRHEGFGMQLVEAMACGTTCFSSGRGALDEIGGGFPLRLDIDSPTAAGAAVAAAARVGDHQRDNRDQVAHALTFDWKDTCGKVVEFVRENLRKSTQ